MRLTTIIAALIATGSAAPAGAQSPVADEPIVQVGLYSYRADGTGQGFAYDTEPADPQVQPRSFGSVVYVSGSFCQIGAGKDPAPAQAADAWRFAGRVVSKAQILDRVWSYDFGGDGRIVESYVYYLRRKIDKWDPPLIHTVRGVGYALRLPRTGEAA